MPSNSPRGSTLQWDAKQRLLHSYAWQHLFDYCYYDCCKCDFVNYGNKRIILDTGSLVGWCLLTALSAQKFAISSHTKIKSLLHILISESDRKLNYVVHGIS